MYVLFIIYTHIYIITIFYMYVFAYVIDTSRTKVVTKAAGSGAGLERSGAQWCPSNPPGSPKGRTRIFS